MEAITGIFSIRFTNHETKTTSSSLIHAIHTRREPHPTAIGCQDGHVGKSGQGMAAARVGVARERAVKDPWLRPPIPGDPLVSSRRIAFANWR